MDIQYKLIIINMSNITLVIMILKMVVEIKFVPMKTHFMSFKECMLLLW